MLAATLARWLVEAPLALFAPAGARGSVRRLRCQPDAVDISRIPCAAAVAIITGGVTELSIAPHSAGRTTGRVSRVMAISGAPDAVGGDTAPHRNAGGSVAVRLAGLQILTPSRCATVPA